MTLQRQIAVSIAVLGLACAQAFAQSAAPTEGGKSAGGKSDTQPTFDVLDTNKDGAISKDESAGMKGLTESFDKLDANKDGKLDSGEFGKAMGK